MPGMTNGIISTTVTFLPSVANSVANSIPMTPPPMMTKLSGSSVIARTSSLVTTFLPSRPGIGGREGVEPIARMILSATIVLPSTSMVFLSTSLPKPFMTSTPCAFSIAPIPPTSLLTTLSLCAAILA